MAAVAHSPEIGKTKKNSNRVKNKIFVLDTCLLIYDHSAINNFEDNRVAVYLTDGFGSFPKNSSLPTLWLVTHDGLEKESFPFGETIRISK